VSTRPGSLSPRLVVVAAVAFSSLSSLFVRLSDAPPLAIAAWRMLLSTALVVPLAAVEHRGTEPRTSSSGVSQSPATARTVALLLVSGTLLATHFATWISSLSLTSVSHSTVLVTMHPVIVLVAGVVFLGEPVDRRRMLAAVGAVLGAVVLAAGGSSAGRSPSLAGDSLAFAGAVAIAGYLVIGRWARRSVGTWVYSLVVYAVATAVLVATAAILGVGLLGYGLVDFLLFAGLAFFCTILGHGLINWGLRYVPAGDVSMMILLEPVFATLMAVVWLGEVPGIVTVLGGFMVLGSALILNRRSAMYTL